MKTLIIYKSIHYGNTEKIAQHIASVLGAELMKIEEVNPKVIKSYDLIGLGSGIYYRKPHKDLLKLINQLKYVQNQKYFVFTTSARNTIQYTANLKKIVVQKGFDVVGEFSCGGFSTWGPLKLVGGFNKGRPNERDIKNAERFANSLKEGLK